MTDAVAKALPDDLSAGDTLPAETSLLRGQFLVEGFLNSGGFGITYLARDSLDRRVVLKECYPSTMCCRTGLQVRARAPQYQHEFEAIVRMFGQEARRLSLLEHPNIVGVRDVFEENGTAYMALDYVDGRDMHDIIVKETWRLDPDTVRDITVSLLDAIGHVHARGMLHRDISPDNVLLTHDDVPILIDFGAARDNARRKSRALSTLHVVKDGYSPQEFYLQAGEQSPASDLFSLAATIYNAITGYPPEVSHKRLAAIAERKPDPYVPLVGAADGYDSRFLAMIDQSLSVFGRDRPQSAADWMAGIAGAGAGSAGQTALLDDDEIAERIRRLVEATNPEVARLQEEKARERAECARQAEAEAAAREAKRLRRLAEARAEAEEAERAWRERCRQEEEARAAAEAARIAAEEARQRAEEAGQMPEDVILPFDAPVVMHAPGAGGVNRAKILKEREEQARLAALEELEASPRRASAQAPAGKPAAAPEAIKNGDVKAAKKAAAKAAKKDKSRARTKAPRTSLLGRFLGGSSREGPPIDEGSREEYR